VKVSILTLRFKSTGRNVHKQTQVVQKAERKSSYVEEPVQITAGKPLIFQRMASVKPEKLQSVYTLQFRRSIVTPIYFGLCYQTLL